MLAPHLDKGFVGALHDALGADVDPRARGHLTIHGKTAPTEVVEMLPRRPMRHPVAIGDQHARGAGMGANDADRLARLAEQGPVLAQPVQAPDDAVLVLPVTRGAAAAALDDTI